MPAGAGSPAAASVLLASRSWATAKARLRWQAIAGVRAAVTQTHRYRPQVPLLPQSRQAQFRRWRGFHAGRYRERRNCVHQHQPALELAQPAAEPELQLRVAATAAAAPAASAPAASAASGDADVPGRFGDPGDGHLPGAAASAAAAASGAGARLLTIDLDTTLARATSRPGLFFTFRGSASSARCGCVPPRFPGSTS